MFKVDELKAFFNRDHCTQLLIDPVTIARANNVCKKHFDELLNEKPEEESIFQCVICQDTHSVSTKSFAVNNRMQRGLERQFNTLKLNPVFDECKEEIAQAKEIMGRIETLEKDPVNYIHEYLKILREKWT